MSNNDIKDIKFLSELQFLLSIDMNTNKITEIPDTLDALKYVQVANFSKNSIDYFGITSWPLLSVLNLNGMANFKKVFGLFVSTRKSIEGN